MFKYHSHYDETTSMPVGVVPSIDDITARQTLLREVGGVVCGEIWHKGYTVLWQFKRELSQSECEILCLKLYTVGQPQQEQS